MKTTCRKWVGGYWKCEEGAFFEGRVITWVNDTGWVKLAAGVDKVGVVAVVRAVIKEESGTGTPEEFD